LNHSKFPAFVMQCFVVWFRLVIVVTLSAMTIFPSLAIAGPFTLRETNAWRRDTRGIDAEYTTRITDQMGIVYLLEVIRAVESRLDTALQVARAGKSHTRITVLSPNRSILFSANLRGSGNDYGTALDVDDHGNVYIVGVTTSTDLQIADSGFQSIQAGIADAFIVKINPGLRGPASVVYATYLGGSGSDMGLGIKVDKAGAAYITGRTNSKDFPVTSGAMQPFSRGGGEAFLTKLSPDGKTIEYSTFLGGSGSDYAYGIDVDDDGNAYVAGTTDSIDFPVSISAFQSRLGGRTDAFVACISADGGRLRYSTYFGGLGFDDAFEIKVDAVNRFRIEGQTDENLTLFIPLPVEQDGQGGFKAAFVIDDPSLMGKKIP
jgi:hypothetical protein